MTYTPGGKDETTRLFAFEWRLLVRGVLHEFTHSSLAKVSWRGTMEGGGGGGRG